MKYSSSIIFVMIIFTSINCSTFFYRWTNDTVYVGKERNDKRSIVVFKDFYKDVPLEKDGKTFGTVRLSQTDVAMYSDAIKQYNLEKQQNALKAKLMIETNANAKLKIGDDLKNINALIEEQSKNTKLKKQTLLKQILSFGYNVYLDNGKSAPLICIEPIGPALTMNKTDISNDKRNLLTIDKLGSSDKGDKVEIVNTQSLGQIYTVSDVMQYAHANMFNLCLMYGNRIIEKDKYEDLLEDLNDSVTKMLGKITDNPEDETDDPVEKQEKQVAKQKKKLQKMQERLKKLKGKANK